MGFFDIFKKKNPLEKKDDDELYNRAEEKAFLLKRWSLSDEERRNTEEDLEKINEELKRRRLESVS